MSNSGGRYADWDNEALYDERRTLRKIVSRPTLGNDAADRAAYRQATGHASNELHEVEEEITYRYEEKERRQEEREERQRKRDEINARKLEGAPARKNARPRTGPTSRDQALSYYFAATNVHQPPKVFTDRIQLGWRNLGLKYLAFFAPRQNELKVWLEVRPDSPGVTVLDGRYYLPANDLPELQAATPYAPR
jgi:hypothetical protein